VRHHTKDKGDIGLACVVSDLLKHGVQVALPISEHLPFDLIAIHHTGLMAKISVKYRELSAHGSVSVRARSSWADRHGVHVNRHRTGDYDAVAVYCPETDRCYYICAAELSPCCTTVRVLAAVNNQKTGIRSAERFIDPDRIFDPAPVAQWIEQAPSKRWAEGSIPSGGADGAA
jgi:hypothetical protein